MKKLKALLLALALLVGGYSQANAATGFISTNVIPTIGNNPQCAGPYVGLSNYRKTAANGWGWSPDPSVSTHIVSDPHEGYSAYIQVVGSSGDIYCGYGWVVIPNYLNTGVPYSVKYRFSAIYPSPLPASPYALQLSGFILP